MTDAADFTADAGRERSTISLSGDWTTTSLGDAPQRLERSLADGGTVDLSGIGRMDTAGAYALIGVLGRDFDRERIAARPETLRLINLVASAVKDRPVAKREPKSFHSLMVRIGKGVLDLAEQGIDTLVFLGHLLIVLGKSILRPWTIRWPAVVSLCERAGLDAIPIIGTTSFFIGAVVALLGANMLQQFGAQVFAVELIGIAVLREFNIIITAVLLAGRSASAFAAEIGSMKMNQEIDAMRIMGVDPYEALVFPRMAALLITIWPLTFVATLTGLLGGMVVTWAVLGLGPAFFFQRIIDNVGVTHFLVGMVKAPVMAAVIAGIGCRQGLEVGGDVESLGRRVTAAVVHAIFAIIMIDAIFALIFMEMDI
jgi:phospholipid/cholesterol/gamma-HCH transport system permease protein